ncbi:hypothetical protein [Microbacterium maritypicum]|uniref:hypothetical protein n=1 Tax=Microbacterium maritypicum TaxID=33918 RepID=UPI003A9141FD
MTPLESIGAQTAGNRRPKRRLTALIAVSIAAVAATWVGGVGAEMATHRAAVDAFNTARHERDAAIFDANYAGDQLVSADGRLRAEVRKLTAVSDALHPHVVEDETLLTAFTEEIQTMKESRLTFHNDGFRSSNGEYWPYRFIEKDESGASSLTPMTTSELDAAMNLLREEKESALGYIALADRYVERAYALIDSAHASVYFLIRSAINKGTSLSWPDAPVEAAEVYRFVEELQQLADLVANQSEDGAYDFSRSVDTSLVVVTRLLEGYVESVDAANSAQSASRP